MLQIANLTYRIDGRPLLESADLTVPSRRRVGLVGRNGCGKSTLLRLIAGDLVPDDGEILLPKSTRIARVAQEAPSGQRSLIETVLAADQERARLLDRADHAKEAHEIADIHVRLADIDAHAAPARAASILKGLGFDDSAQNEPCDTLSGGWRMRVALAATLFVDSDLLLLDEPTNYLDLEGTIWLDSFLRRYQGTLILVSHDRDLLNSSVEGIVHFENRKLSFYAGGYDEFEEARRLALDQQAAARRKQDNERERIRRFVDRFRYKASKARQVQSRLKVLERMQPIPALLEDSVPSFKIPEPKPIAPPLISIESAAAGYVPGRPVLRRINLRLDPDSRVALLGANGNGKSTLARLIAGRLDPVEGSIRRAPKIKIGFLTQHQIDDLDPDQSAFEHLAAVSPRGTPEDRLRARLGAVGFTGEQADTPSSELSGGEKTRLLLALAVRDAPHLLVLDEPTNHLDIESREAFAQSLNEYTGAIVLVSHDRHLINACIDDLHLVSAGSVERFDGGLDDYRRLVLNGPDAGDGPATNQERADRNQVSAQQTGRKRRRMAADRRKSLAPLRKSVAEAEAHLEKLVQERRQLESALADPAVYDANQAKAADLAREKGRLDKKIGEAERAWLVAQEALEAELNEDDS